MSRMTIKNNTRRSLVYGIGVNDADYIVSKRVNGKYDTCHIYRTWRNMLERCYSESFRARIISYDGCTVAKEWHLFSNFKKWMEVQDWEGKELDKDIMYPGSKLYSPETCVFVARAINLLLTNRASARGRYPQGVHLNKLTNSFKAQISKNGRRYHIGLFDTPEEASAAYRETKRLHILTVACCEPDIRVKQGLHRHSETL